MMQSPCHSRNASRLHVAVIMDGNGRWAARRGLPREAGHRAGAQAGRRVIAAARELGIGCLTLFAFSADNWQRPRDEVENLMRVYEDFLRLEKDEWAARGIRLSVLGRRDRLPAGLREAIEAAEAGTASGQEMHLRLAIDYSGRESILRAARRFDGSLAFQRETFSRLLAEAMNAGVPIPDIDLLIRSGGERRLSDFMLWESAYAELVFTERMWPDFDAADLVAALDEYHRRERRFGRIPEVAVHSHNH